MSRTSDDFPEPEIPATVVIAPMGMRSVTSLEVVPGSLDQLQPIRGLRVERGARGALRDVPREVAARQGLRIRRHFGERPRRDDPAARFARARPHVDHEVRRADRVLVVFDHDDGVPEVAQTAERFDQAVVVALMKPDAGFVQNVEDAGEARADLARQTDALALASGERVGAAPLR